MIMASQGERIAQLYRRFRVGMADMDAWWAGYAATVPAMAGSWLSFMYYGAGLWALLSVALRRFPIDIPRPARPFVLACVAYFAAMLLAALVNGNLAELPRGMATATGFLFLPLLVSRLRFSDPERAWRMFRTYAPLGVVAGAILGGYQLYADAEISGGAGNPNVYAVVMADLGVFSLAGVFVQRGRVQALCMAAFMLAALAILASGARSIFPVILLAPIILVWLARRHLSANRVRIVIGTLILIIGVATLISRDKISGGIASAKRDIEMASENRFDTSLGMRIVLWKAGIEAARYQPILGYGPQNKMDAVYGFLDDRLSYLSFSHLHNAALDTMIAAGMPGLVALAALLLTPFMLFTKGGHREVDRRFAVYAHVLVFALSGAMGALFTHDLLAVSFLLPLAVLAATAKGTAVQERTY